MKAIFFLVYSLSQFSVSGSLNAEGKLLRANPETKLAPTSFISKLTHFSHRWVLRPWSITDFFL